MFLTPEEVQKGAEMLSSCISVNVDAEHGDEIASHMNDLSSVQANAALIVASAKFHYLKDKKSAEANAMYLYCENLHKNLHYKISSLQSILRKEVQAQFQHNIKTTNDR